MAIIYAGTYQFARRHVGFRPDFCLCCEQETIAREYRSFEVRHLWWIPVLPVGFRRHWYCTACGEDPRGARTGMGMKIFWILLLALCSVVFWVDPPDDDLVFTWIVRIGFPIVIVLIARSFRSGKERDAVLVERLRKVSPIGHRCPICGGQVKPTSPRACASCGAVEGRAPELMAS